MIATDLLVLHTLRCLGSTDTARLAAAAGLDGDDTLSELIDLGAAGLVAHEFGGWSLTAAGKLADAERIAAELDRSGARPAVTAAYEEFLLLNPELLDLCAAFQLRPADGPRVLDLLADLHRRAEPVCADLAAALPRFGRYPVRLAAALSLARSGRDEYVTNHLDSYHVVWFQLHEDLLATLGTSRWS